MLWEVNVDRECSVSINGQECDRCSFEFCPGQLGGLLSWTLDCRNVQPNGILYNGCNPFDYEEVGGQLDVWKWVTTETWTGCPFVTNLEE